MLQSVVKVQQYQHTPEHTCINKIWKQTISVKLQIDHGWASVLQALITVRAASTFPVADPARPNRPQRRRYYYSTTKRSVSSLYPSLTSAVRRYSLCRIISRTRQNSVHPATTIAQDAFRLCTHAATYSHCRTDGEPWQSDGSADRRETRQRGPLRDPSTPSRTRRFATCSLGRGRSGQ